MRRSVSRLISLISLVSATALVGCSGEDTPDAGTPDSGVNPADTGTVTPDSGTETPDSGVEPDAGETPDSGVTERCIIEGNVDVNEDPSCTGEWIATVRGVLQTNTGEGIDEARAQVCVRSPTGTLNCLRPERSCNGGEWELLVPDIAAQPRCIESLVMRTFSFNEPFAETFCNFDVTGQGPRMTLPNPVTMYPVTAPANLPALGEADQARTVTFANGLEMDVTPDGFTDEFSRDEYDRLASVYLAGDVSPRPCFYGASEDYDGLWGFIPQLDISTGNGFPFRISTSLTQGTMVDLYVLGGLECEVDDETVEEGHWEQFATVTVGAGGVISGEMPCFNWFAYKAR